MKLNLPDFDYQLRKADPEHLQIYDRLRKKFVALTPEEWVRQHFVNFLIEYRKYPALYMANEVGIMHNGCRRRCDTIIYDHSAHPVGIVEYKASDVEITPMVFDQIVRYNMVLHVNHLIVSNGITHFCCRIDYNSQNYHFLRDIPAYDAMCM